jgi:hypothetical protein
MSVQNIETKRLYYLKKYTRRKIKWQILQK